MPIVAAIPYVLAAASVAATVASTAAQKQAANSQASIAQGNAATDTAVGAYNQKVDQAQADQIDADTLTNIDNMRQNAAVYMSRQASSYVAAGVNANSGSALAVRAATAGKFAQQEQQKYQDAQAQEELLASQGQAGVAYGAAQAESENMEADVDHQEGVAAVLSGAGKVSGLLLNDYAALRSGSGGGGGDGDGGGSGTKAGTGANNLSDEFDD